MDETDNFHSMTESETSFKKRPRKKHLYRQILQQMEFYFSEANLARDRFLAQLLEESHNIPLEVFLRFNKIRAMTGNIEDIAKALGSSDLLQVTEDGKHVFMAKPVQEKTNREDCMIYVEQLPADANHDWVIGIFSAYGKVEYVSIPKYKNRSAIKGFAFVEFDTPDAANKALEAFGSAGCCLPPQMPPEELCSVATYEGTEELERTDADYEAKEEDRKKYKKKVEDSSEETEENNGKLRGTDLEEMECEEPKSKKLKTEYNEPHGGKCKKKKDKTKIEDSNQISEEFTAESETVEPARTKKGKKRKLENENTENLNETSYDIEEDPDNNSHLISKKKKKHQGEVESVVDESENFQMLETETSEAQSAGKSKKKKKRQQLEIDEMKNEDNEVEEEDDEAAVVSHDAEETKKKRKKKKHAEVESEDDANREGEEVDEEGTAKRAKKQKNVEGGDDNNENEEVEVENEGDLEKPEKKKKRKRIKKKAKKETDPTSLGLRIISRKEWGRLRSKYLNLQREKMRALKKHLARAKFGSNYQSPYPSKENVQQEEGKDKNSKSNQKCKFVPGAIIHIDLDEPLGDSGGFKRNAQSHPGVAYVEANDGDSEVHIRCFTSEVAQGLVNEKLWDNMKILEGEAESNYWKKIQEDRANRIKESKITHQVRGRNKLLKRAERELGKHIKFDD